MTSLQNNQDTLSPSNPQIKSVVNKSYNKQRALQEHLQTINSRAAFSDCEQITVSPSARKMLETVLINSKISAVPTSKDEYAQLFKKLTDNNELYQINVARIIRSLSDQLKYDSKLQQLVVKELGFQQQTRIFHNDESQKALLIKEEDELDSDIGYVQLGYFIEKFGKMFEITQQNESLKNLMGSQESNQTQNNVSFMSPMCSQQQINEARQLEIMQITSVFGDPQSRYLQQSNKQEIFDTTQSKWGDKKQSKNNNDNQENEMDDCYDLLAHENLEVLQNQTTQVPNYHPMQFLSSHQTKNRFPQHSRLMDDIANYTNNKQLKQQQQQQQKDSFEYHRSNSYQQQIDNRKESQQQVQQQQQLQQQQPVVQQPDFNKNLLDFQPLQQYKLFPSNSLLSANNSMMNTPINHKDNQNLLYPNNSTFKPKSSAKLLFSQNNPNSSPKYIPNSFTNIQAREFTNARTLFHSEAKQQLPQSPMIYKQILGQKQRSHYTVENLERDVNKQQQDDIFTTPVNKRMKSEKIYSSGFKNTTSAIDDIVNDSSSDSEEEDKADGEINDNISSASRKKRGLKILSVKVQELVYKKQQTTYKDVANELIKQLRDNKKRIQEFDGIDNDDSGEGFGEDDYLSDESPNKRGDQTSSSQQKWEKNVRRRVYDALNVLYAAGVLKKDGKHVSCDNKVLQLTNKLKDPAHSSNLKLQNQRNSVQDTKMMQKIEQLRYDIAQVESRVEQKRETLFDQYKHYISYKHLIQRNKDNKDKGYYDPSKSVSLPFILVSTKDCPENEVEISFGEQNKSLNIAMKKPMKCIGDADTLIKLDMYKVQSQWLQQNIPESHSIPILQSLNEKQRKEILIQ